MEYRNDNTTEILPFCHDMSKQACNTSAALNRNMAAVSASEEKGTTLIT